MKTAVQWLLNEQHLLNIDDSITKKQYIGKRRKIESQALDMEKEQIINAHVFGWSDGFDLRENKQSRLATEYYNQTYNQNK
jgi:hypothetical protein